MTSTRKCQRCGSEFVPHHTSRAGLYCSQGCYQASRAGKIQKEAVKHRLKRAAGHPIAPPSGVVAVSRVVLYDKIGPGPHPCHWCGRQVEWRPGRGLRDDALIVDHLNHDATNDAPDNLVPSCNSCNSGRAKGATYNKNVIRPGEPFVITSSGRRSRVLQRYCNICGEGFMSKVSEINAGKGLYCSRSCARKAPRKDRAASSRDRVRNGG